jgi:ferric-dicitrate binding protein FerR (iron transport regulator)
MSQASSRHGRAVSGVWPLVIILRHHEPAELVEARMALNPYRAPWRRAAFDAGWFAAGAYAHIRGESLDVMLSHQAKVAFDRGFKARSALDVGRQIGGNNHEG